MKVGEKKNKFIFSVLGFPSPDNTSNYTLALLPLLTH